MSTATLTAPQTRGRRRRKPALTTAELQARLDRRDSMSKPPRKPAPEIKDAPPKLEWIHKSQLAVDPAYQREANLTKVEKIAAGWSWKALGTLQVAKRGDGKFLVFEGGHRLLASKQRVDVQELPCAIYPSAGVVE